MPRTRMQAPSAPNHQAYGQRGDQMAAQDAMPIPQSAPPPLQPGGGGGAPPVTAAPPQPQAPAGPGQPGIPPEILAQAVGTMGGTPLTAATTRPGEPVTAGLAIGAGAGPEALASMFQARRNRVADTLQRLADDLGDGYLQELADKARAQAGR